MMADGIGNRAVPPHRDSGEFDPLPQLCEITRGICLRIQNGDDVRAPVVILDVVQAGGLRKVIGQIGGGRVRIVV